MKKNGIIIGLLAVLAGSSWADSGAANGPRSSKAMPPSLALKIGKFVSLTANSSRNPEVNAALNRFAVLGLDLEHYQKQPWNVPAQWLSDLGRMLDYLPADFAGSLARAKGAEEIESARQQLFDALEKAREAEVDGMATELMAPTILDAQRGYVDFARWRSANNKLVALSVFGGLAQNYWRLSNNVIQRMKKMDQERKGLEVADLARRILGSLSLGGVAVTHNVFPDGKPAVFSFNPQDVEDVMVALINEAGPGQRMEIDFLVDPASNIGKAITAARQRGVVVVDGLRLEQPKLVVSDGSVMMPVGAEFNWNPSAEGLNREAPGAVQGLDFTQPPARGPRRRDWSIRGFGVGGFKSIVPVPLLGMLAEGNSDPDTYLLLIVGAVLVFVFIILPAFKSGSGSGKRGPS